MKEIIEMLKNEPVESKQVLGCGVTITIIGSVIKLLGGTDWPWCAIFVPAAYPIGLLLGACLICHIFEWVRHLVKKENE